MTGNKQWPTRAQFDALKSQVDSLGAGDGTGGGAVNSVAGKTGDVTLTPADVGLGDIPARVTALEGRAQLNVEQVQDILGQMLGEAQGHYDDAAGTYTVNLPAGGALDTEQVQDIMGALIRAGSNATVTYDDTANTLTVSATGSGSELTRLRTVFPSRSGFLALSRPTSFGGNGSQIITMLIEVLQPLAFSIIETISQNNGAVVEIWDSALQNLRATGTVTQNGTLYRAVFNQALNFSSSERLNVRFKRSPQVIIDTSLQGGVTSPDGAVKMVDSTSGFAIPLDFVGSDATQYKQVLGPLDPTDFPRSKVTEAPNSSGFMVVDDAAKTASLYWKFSDGSTKKLDLT